MALPTFTFAQSFGFLYLVILTRYFIVSGFFYFLCFSLKRGQWQHKKVEERTPTRRQIQSEIFWSVISCSIFALVGALGVKAWELGYSNVYLDVSQYGIAYLLGIVPVLMIIQDTYFYWVHRLMHHPLLFLKVHKVHHESTNPSPWASFSFHPLEAILEAAILPLVALVIPVHPISLLIFLTLMTVFGVTNHLGYELLPKNFVTNPVLRAWLTTTHHHQHHRHFRFNYGLYFTLWDRWMKTEHESYERKFREIAERKPLPEVPSLTVETFLTTSDKGRV